MGRSRSFRTNGLAANANRVGLLALLITLCQYGIPAAVMGMLRLAGADVDARAWGLDYAVYLLIYAAVYLAVMGIPTAVGQRWIITPKMRATAPLTLSAKRQVFTVVGGLACCLLCNAAAAGISRLLYKAGVPEPEMPGFGDGSLRMLMLDLAVYAVLPAIMEERLFRGMMLQSLRPFGNGTAIVLSSVLFGFVHGNAAQVPYALLMGAVLGVIFVRTGSLRLSTTVHLLANALAVVNAFWLHFCTAQTATFWQTVLMTVVVTTGAPAIVWLWRHPLGHRRVSSMSFADKRQALSAAPVLWVAVIVMMLLMIVLA